MEISVWRLSFQGILRSTRHTDIEDGKKDETPVFEIKCKIRAKGEIGIC